MEVLEKRLKICNNYLCWGTSSFGRALPWHGRGEEFESPVLHQKNIKKVVRPYFFYVFLVEQIGDESSKSSDSAGAE